MFVNILISTSVSKLNKVFTYIVPVELEQYICVGKRVVVPFSKNNRKEIGTVLDIIDKIDFDEKLAKPVISIVDEKVNIDEFRIKLAKWMSKRYICNFSECIKLMFPPDIVKNGKKIRTSKKEKVIFFNDKIIIEPNSKKRKEIFEYLKNNNVVELLKIYNDLNINSASLKWFKDNSVIEIKEELLDRKLFEKYDGEVCEKLVLTKKQKNVYDGLNKLINLNKMEKALLYGVTGSGKTEIYMQIIENVLEKGKNAIILVPEISLTPQMANRFLSRFGNVVSILHSKLSNGERIDEYSRIKNGDVRIVIGVRSAIFAPLDNIGIIIIDEEHDSSYKSETNPKYDAIEIATKLAIEYNCLLLLGSATPSISTYYEARKGDMNLFVLDERINNVKMPKIELVDLSSRNYYNNSKIITNTLKNEIEMNLKNKEQTIIFLNRRGYCSYIICKDCGKVEKCPNCDVSLTYHKDKKKLLCHYCGYTTNLKRECTQCGSNNLDTNILGTQKVENEIKQIFPDASIIRMDHDTTLGKDGYLNILSTFKKDNIDILIGTQMIAKGHDFPNVTLVCVLNGDATTYLQDYRANELTYSLLTQVSGRAGRKEKQGRVLIQTYQVDNEIFNYIINNDYEKMYENEINYRKLLNYPPFCDIIQILITSNNEELTIKESDKVYNLLKEKLFNYLNKQELNLFSPVQATISKMEKQYRYKVNIKCKYSLEISNILREVLNSFNNNKNVKISIDVNSNKNI